MNLKFAAAVSLALLSHTATAALSSQDLMQKVEARPEAAWQSATMVLTVTAKGGSPQTKEAVVFSHLKDAGRQSAIYFRAPAPMKKTAFLSVDQAQDAADEQWLYLPALQSVRRVPASNRGEAFLGTDLSYEDVRKVGKVTLSDYTLSDPVVVNDRRVEITGMATPDASKALGHAKAIWGVDPQTLFISDAQYFDATGKPIKRARTEGVRSIEGFWTADRMMVENLRTGSQTVVEFRDTRFGQSFDIDILSPKGIQSGKGLK